MNTIETTLQVNRFARRSRHLKIFSRGEIVKIHALDMLRYFFAPIGLLFKLPFILKIRGFFVSLKNYILNLIPAAPPKRLLFQTSILASALLIMTSLSSGATLTAVSMSYSNDYIGAYSLPGDVLVSDDEGYLIKINPQTGNANRIGMTDYAVHTIEAGESLSVISQRYSVSVATIMWENHISNANTIRSGQKLLIPPVDGISYTVSNGDTLEKVAKTYNITADTIIAQNALETTVIHKGQELFLPGAKPIAPVNVASANYRVSAVSRAVSYASSASSSPAAGKTFIFPTTGKLTQGYRGGHYALDISDHSRPPVWAAGTGTVSKVEVGSWGGGYGNFVVIDHGDGLQTLYAHLDSVNVSAGQFVNQGDVLGIMGNTGRVYGATGIHLHWEVVKDGVKQYPANYY